MLTLNRGFLRGCQRSLIDKLDGVDVKNETNAADPCCYVWCDSHARLYTQPACNYGIIVFALRFLFCAIDLVAAGGSHHFSQSQKPQLLLFLNDSMRWRLLLNTEVVYFHNLDPNAASPFVEGGNKCFSLDITKAPFPCHVPAIRVWDCSQREYSCGSFSGISLISFKKKKGKLLNHCQRLGKALSVCVLFQNRTCIISPEDGRYGCACQAPLYWTDNLYASPPSHWQAAGTTHSLFWALLSKVSVFALSVFLCGIYRSAAPLQM